jgi:hypothetical protein
VIESYWLGSDELKKAKQKDYQILLENFKKQGVPDFFVEELRVKKLKKFIPNHLISCFVCWCRKSQRGSSI